MYDVMAQQILENLLDAYAAILEHNLKCWREKSPEKVTRLWLLPPDMTEASTIQEWSLVFYKRLLLRIVVFQTSRLVFCSKRDRSITTYGPSGRKSKNCSIKRRRKTPCISVSDFEKVFAISWLSCVRQPGYSAGHWLSQVVCGPITQHALDMIHRKTINIIIESTEKTIANLFSGKKVSAKSPLAFYVSDYEASLVKQALDSGKIVASAVQLVNHKGDRETQSKVEHRAVICLSRPIPKEMAVLLGQFRSLVPVNIASMTSWKHLFGTRALQEHVQDVLTNLVSSTPDHWIIPATRLLSNLITMEGKIKAINRYNIDSERDLISKALFETPSKNLLTGRWKKEFKDMGSSAAFLFGTDNGQSGIAFADVEVLSIDY